MKGDNYLVDADQLYELLLKKIDEKYKNKFNLIFNKNSVLTKDYIEIYDKNNDSLLKEIQKLSKECDDLTFKLYNLTEEEIEIIGNSLN